ncbi:hypothetical protein LTS15_003360 [Exophiala xenobiotica]|nr:hypothetical protein LTS15_003360 [Exophiala xenobiotica]
MPRGTLHEDEEKMTIGSSYVAKLPASSLSRKPPKKEFPQKYSHKHDFRGSNLYNQCGAWTASGWAEQSQGLKIGNYIFTSGQLPSGVKGTIDYDSPIGVQTEKCIKNVAAILEAAGSSIRKVVKVSVFLTDINNYAEVNVVYGKWFAHKPVRTLVAVMALPKGAAMEIDVIALAD